MKIIKPLGLFMAMLFSISMACILGSQPDVVLTPTQEENLSPISTITPTSELPKIPLSLDPCPSRQSLPSPQKEYFDDYPEEIEKYLAQGGDPEYIQLDEGDVCISVDLTGDQYTESVCLFIDKTSTFIVPKSIIAVYQCIDGSVHLIKTYQPDEWGRLEIVGASDITLDGVEDFIFAEVQCGAHTCWHSLHVWSWTGTALTQCLGGELSFPFPEYYLDNDTLIIESAGIGSVGAGPQRLMTTTVAWDGSAVTATLTKKEPAVFRYHVFIDGDAVLQVGDFLGARDYFIQVIEDNSLQSWGVTYTVDEEKSWLLALAYWRLLNISAINNDLVNVRHYLNLLNENIAVNTAGYPVVEISSRYWQTIQSDALLEKACSEVYTTSSGQKILDFLNSFGYANPHYQIDALCFHTAK